MASEGAAAETAASPSKQSWAQARDSSHQLVLQTALEDLEAQAVKLRQERDDFKVKSEQQDEEAATLKRKIQELQAQVSSKESEAFETTQEAKTRLEQAKILEDDSKSKLERSDRLEKEADALREEIRYGTEAVGLRCCIASQAAAENGAPCNLNLAPLIFHSKSSGWTTCFGFYCMPPHCLQ